MTEVCPAEREVGVLLDQLGHADEVLIAGGLDVQGVEAAHPVSRAACRCRGQLGLVAAGIGVALIPRMALEHGDRDDVVAPPFAHPTILRRVEVALPAGGYLPSVTQELVDALIAAATGLDRPPEKRGPDQTLDRGCRVQLGA